MIDKNDAWCAIPQSDEDQMGAVSMFRLAITVWQGAREEWQVRTAGPLGPPLHWFLVSAMQSVVALPSRPPPPPQQQQRQQQQHTAQQLFQSPVCFIPLCFKPHGSACVSCHRPLQDAASHHWSELCALWGFGPDSVGSRSCTRWRGWRYERRSAAAGSCSVLCVVLWWAVWLCLCG